MNHSTPHRQYDVTIFLFMVNLHCRLRLLRSVYMTRVVSTGMWWSAIIQAYPQYQRISTFHIFVWIVYYVFGVGHERISCSAAKDCVVNNIDSWIIVLSLRHIHMMLMWYVWQEWSWVTQQHTTHPTRSLFRTVRYDSFHRLHHLPVHMFVIRNIVELSILHIARWAHTSWSNIA